MAVLVPWRGGEPWRERAWRHCSARWAQLGWPLIAAGMAQEGPFSRARARNEAARLAEPWDVAVFADADTIVRDRQQVQAGIDVALTTGRLVLPFTRFTGLTQPQTLLLLAGRLELPEVDTEPDPSVGGVVVVPRSLWHDVGGYDERFVGWGFEDSAFAVAAGGPARTPGRIWHLWHPAAPETDPRHPQHRANRAVALEHGVRFGE